jgi:hypothetical protein
MKIEKNEKIFIGMIVLIVVVLVGAYYLIPYLAKDDLPASLGLFGDQFGAVNALFSGLAFAGLIYTILLQKEELKAQREELTLTRQEIEGQKLELKQQNETFTLQRFETSFFNMLSQHNQMVSEIIINQVRGKSIVRDIINTYHLHEQIDFVALLRALKSGSYTEEEIKQAVNNNFEEIYSHYQMFLGAYFRSLYRVFKFIDESKIQNKRSYTDIIRSQLTDDELCLLFLNGLTNKGKNFRRYIEEYSLLDNLPLDKIGDNIRSVYKEKAYKSECLLTEG